MDNDFAKECQMFPLPELMKSGETCTSPGIARGVKERVRGKGVLCRILILFDSPERRGKISQS